MKSKLFAQRGQALILIALAAIGLFGIAGLAIDGSAKFSDRRHAQNAADTAALAGALEMARGGAYWDTEALNRAADNGYDDDLVTNNVEVYNPPASGIYADCSDVHFDCNDYVQVIITSHVNTWFARVVGINQTHNRVEAVASTFAENNSFNFGGNAIVALSPEGCALVAAGTTNVTVTGGGLYSNSDESCAFKKTTCSGLVRVIDRNNNQGTITTVGGYQTNSNCSESLDADFSVGAKQLPFPPRYQELDEPAECSTAGGRTSDATTTYLTPGYFDRIPGNGNGWKSNIVLSPGVYCVGTEMRTNNGENLTVSGSFLANPLDPGVFIYFKPGADFTFNASSIVILWGINANNDSSLSKYAGYLMYVAPDYASGTPTNCTINGNSSDAFRGTIYAPYCNIKLNGTSSPSGFQSQLIGYTVDLSGTSDINLTYDDETSPVWDLPLQVGLNK